MPELHHSRPLRIQGEEYLNLFHHEDHEEQEVNSIDYSANANPFYPPKRLLELD